jgi:hypothetical protein
MLVAVLPLALVLKVPAVVGFPLTVRISVFPAALVNQLTRVDCFATRIIARVEQFSLTVRYIVLGFAFVSISVIENHLFLSRYGVFYFSIFFT